MIITANKIQADNKVTFDIDYDLFSKVVVIEDNVNTVVLEVEKKAEIIAKKNEALKASSQLVIAEKLLSENLPLDRIEEFAQIFDFPVAGQVYTLNWVLRDRVTNELFRIIQPTVTWEAWWVIADIPSIVTPFRPPNTVTPWIQPTGAQDAYAIGAKVSHNGFTWESTINANTTEPAETVFNWWVKV